MTNAHLPPSLSVGTLPIRDLGGAEVTEEWAWHDRRNRWALKVRLYPDVADDGPISSPSNAYVLASAEYPEGSVSVHPSEKGGIDGTYPHMVYGPSLDESKPWRKEGLCLNHPRNSLNRLGGEEEPEDRHDQLIWYIRRAIRWYELASRGELLQKGEHFTLPVRPTVSHRFLRWQPTVAFHEDEAWLHQWDSAVQGGKCSFGAMDRNLLVVRRYRKNTGSAVKQISWGGYIDDLPKADVTGRWVRLPEVPVTKKWRPPKTWGELRAVCHRQGIDLDVHMKNVLPRRKENFILLVGFPIPDRVREAAKQFHWWGAVVLFDDDAGSHRTEDDDPICWLRSSNWSPMEVSTRGKLTESLSNDTILLIGAGALGSTLSELLVRGRAQKLLVIDRDTLEAGNLVRHTLSLDEVGKNKAEALAARLESLSPNVEAIGHPHHFPPSNDRWKGKVREADIIIDCTGEDETLRQLQTFDWKGKKLFFSFSISDHARRLYVFSALGVSFPADAFDKRMEPWYYVEGSESVDEELPWEGTGCHHPVFEARQDDVTALLGSALKWIEQSRDALKNGSGMEKPQLKVFEHTEDRLGVQVGILSDHFGEEQLPEYE